MSTIIRKKEVPRIQLSDDVNNRINEGWKALKERDGRVFNGTLLRVVGDVNADSNIVSVTSDIGYREVVGARSYTDFLDWIPEAEQFQVLSAIAFMKTSDNKYLLRDRSTGDWERSIELAGGFITDSDTPNTVEEYIKNRVASDLSMSPEVVSSVNRIGHIDFKSICESMFVYNVSLSITYSEIQQTEIKFFEIPQGYTPEKHHEFFALPLHLPSKRVLEEFLGSVTGK